jgi:hypothetical protein
MSLRSGFYLSLLLFVVFFPGNFSRKVTDVATAPAASDQSQAQPERSGQDARQDSLEVHRDQP